jgi:hypothetical protein
VTVSVLEAWRISTSINFAGPEPFTSNEAEVIRSMEWNTPEGISMVTEPFIPENIALLEATKCLHVMLNEPPLSVDRRDPSSTDSVWFDVNDTVSELVASA